MIARRILLLSLVAICALNVACAELALDPDGFWEATPSRYPLVEEYFPVSYSRALAICGGSPTCARYDYENQVCRIYFGGAVLEDWAREHELKHCKGYDHARWPVQVRFQ